jgi:hypothetical protein
MISQFLAREFPPFVRGAVLLVLTIVSIGVAFGAAVTLMVCAPATL